MRILPCLTLPPRLTALLRLTPLLLTACAHEELAARPPSGVDLSGQWKLNVADSDDPMRLTQAALASATAGAGPGGTTSPQGGTGRGQRQGGAGGFGPAGPMGPSPPSVMMLDDALRWPGRDLAIHQSGANVTFSSGGRDENCQPGEHPHGPKPPPDNPRSHDAPTRGRGDAPPPRCGWDQATLIVQPRDREEPRAPFDAAFSLSEDRQRLIEVVTFHSGRSSGFTASRVWDRVTSVGASGSAGAPGTGVSSAGVSSAGASGAGASGGAPGSVPPR